MADLTSPAGSGFGLRSRNGPQRVHRREIAEAMKAEAGVAAPGDLVGDEEFAGLAFLESGLVTSTEERAVVELWTVAHTCGHSFLHRRGTPGFRLPPHVREMEADQYTHQCFVEHGLKVPKRLRKAARAHIATRIVKDRASGMPIDPRVEEYVRGLRSPYEPLREVPSAWRLHRARSHVAKLRRLIRGTDADAAGPTIFRELRNLPPYLWSWFLAGGCLTVLVLALAPGPFGPADWIRPLRLPDVGPSDLIVTVTGGLIWACAGMMWRTLRR